MPAADVESAETCMSENTTLPQRWSAATFCGVVNWKFIALDDSLATVASSSR